jgi:hypothetical protein
MEVRPLGGGAAQLAHLDVTGAFQADLKPGKYRIRVRAANHLSAEREVTVTRGKTLDLGTVVVWAGDLNDTGRIHAADQRICALAGAPVNDQQYDLNGDELVNGQDCQIVAANAGENEPTRANPGSGSAALVTDTFQPLAVATSEPIAVCAKTATTISLCLGSPTTGLGGVAAKLRLPPGIALVEVTAEAALAGYYLTARQEGQIVYIMAAMDEEGRSLPLTETIPFVRVAVTGQGEGVALESYNTVAQARGTTWLFLPLLTR